MHPGDQPWVTDIQSVVRTTHADINNGRFRVLAILHAEEDRLQLDSSSAGADVHLRVLGSVPEVTELLRREPFELLLLDADLPQSDLQDAIRRVRVVTLDLPIIFLAAQPSDEVMLFSMETGSLDVLRKPLDGALLRRLVVTQRERLRGAVRANVETFVVRKSVSYAIPCDVNLIPLVANKVAAEIHATGAIDSGQMYSLNLAVFECLTNSLEHGNLEIGFDRKTDMVKQGEYLARLRDLCNDSPFSGRKIFLEYDVEPDLVQVRISDEGPGFDFAAIQETQTGADQEAFHGRGLLLAMKMVDEVSYDRDSNQLRLVVHRASSAQG